MSERTDAFAVTSEHINALQLSPPFRLWVHEAHVRGHLDIIVEAVILTDCAQTIPDAIAYLHELCQEKHDTPKRVALSDLKRENPWSKIHRQLCVALGKTEPTHRDLATTHGSIGHAAIPQIFSSQLLRNGRQVERGGSGQLLLPLEPVKSRQRTLGFLEGQPAFVPEGGPALENGRLIGARALVKRALSFWEKYCDVVATEDQSEWRQLVPELRAIMQPLFGNYATSLDRHPMANPSITFLTLMSWVGVLGYWIEHRPKILFPEVNAVLPRHGFSGGRIDALELRGMNGRRLTKRQIARLRWLQEQKPPHRSSGEVLCNFEQNFRGKLGVAIVDWKFGVGDAQNRGDTILP